MDIVATGFSPGVRRMMGQVGGKEAFEDGRRDLELLAGLRLTTKAVERVAEAVGGQIEQRNQREQKQILGGRVIGIWQSNLCRGGPARPPAGTKDYRFGRRG